MMKSGYEPENLSLSEEQGFGRVNGRLVANYFHNHATSIIKRHFMESTK